MEATSDYWQPVFYLLEDAFDCWLLNAAHIKGVPGRKTDVRDSEWIAQLVECGLVRPSFVPPAPIRELRDLTRYRKTIFHDTTTALGCPIHERFGLVAAEVTDDVFGSAAWVLRGVQRTRLYHGDRQRAGAVTGATVTDRPDALS